MSVSLVEAYRSICEKHNVKPIYDLETSFIRDQTIVDASQVYFPRTHLRTILQLINDHDVNALILDEAQLSENDVKMLAKELVHVNLCKLSLNGVQMSISSGKHILDLCDKNNSIVSISLEDTLLPPHLIESISTIVDANALSAAQMKATEQRVIHPVARSPARCILSMWKEEITTSLRTPSPREEGLGPVSGLLEGNFTDHSFPLEEDLPRQECVTLTRVSDLMAKDSAEAKQQLIFPETATTLCTSHLSAAVHLALNDHVLRRKYMSFSLNSIGRYTFRLYPNGGSVDVIIDDRVPVTRHDNAPTLTGLLSSFGSFRIALLEKAMAKCLGGYETLRQLSFAQSVRLLTRGLLFELDFPARLGTSHLSTFMRKSLDKRLIFGYCTPPSQWATDALLQRGFLPNFPYIVVGTDAHQVDGSHAVDLVQLIGPSACDCTEVFTADGFERELMHGFPIFWVTLETFVDAFDRLGCLLLDEISQQTTEATQMTFPVRCSSGTGSSQFACNPSFYVENLDRQDCDVFLSVRGGDECRPGDDAEVELSFFSPSENPLLKRYDISTKNRLFSAKLSPSRSVVVPLRPLEKLQMVISSAVTTELMVTASTVASVSIVPLTESSTSVALSGTFCVARGNIRLPEKMYAFTNDLGDNTIQHVTVVITQRSPTNVLRPLSAKIWVGKPAFLSLDNPSITTEMQISSSIVCNVNVRVPPGESFMILPCVHNGLHDIDFTLTVFSSPVSMELVSVDEVKS